jgi:hypothetical protein
MSGADRGAGLRYGNAGAAGERAGCSHLTQVVTKNGEAGAGVGLAVGIAAGIGIGLDADTRHSLTASLEAAVGV